MRFNIRLVGEAAVHRADLGTLFCRERADALGAFSRIDDVDIFPFGNRRVRALRLARAAANALIGDLKSHVFVLPVRTSLPLIISGISISLLL